jgi:hypothetical protein
MKVPPGDRITNSDLKDRYNAWMRQVYSRMAIQMKRAYSNISRSVLTKVRLTSWLFIACKVTK